MTGYCFAKTVQSVVRAGLAFHVELIHTWDFRVLGGRRGSMYRLGVRGNVSKIVVVYSIAVQWALLDWPSDQS